MIPAPLESLPNWVHWRREERGGQMTKVPVNPRTGHRASSVEPNHWTTHREAVAFLELHARLYPGHERGLGFVFERRNRVVGVDLDHVLVGGKLDPKAQQVVEEMDSYTEFSPSQTGLHVFVLADWPGGSGRRTGGWLEVYAEARYFTWTGETYGDPKPDSGADRSPRRAPGPGVPGATTSTTSAWTPADPQ